MSGKPVVLREWAQRDVDAAVAYYLSEAGSAGAPAFIDALETCLRQIGEYPAAGASHYAHELDLPGLRFRTVGRFPYLGFYVEQRVEIDVWRPTCPRPWPRRARRFTTRGSLAFGSRACGERETGERSGARRQFGTSGQLCRNCIRWVNCDLGHRPAQTAICMDHIV